MICGFKQVSSFYKRKTNTPNKKQTPNGIILDIGISVMVAIFWKSDMEEPDGRQRQAVQDGCYAARRLQGSAPSHLRCSHSHTHLAHLG